MFDFGKQGKDEFINSSPFVNRRDELLPNLDVGFASHQKSLQLRNQLIEILD